MSETQTSQLVQSQQQDGILEITLVSPPWNILNLEMIRQLEEVARGVSDQVRVVLLRAEGKGFCAGVAVEDHFPDSVEEMLVGFKKMLMALHQCPVPTIAAVSGAALGGGLELACAADILFAADRTKLGQPEIQLAALAPAALLFLPRRVGFHRAADLLFSGRTVRAEEAVSWGLVDFVSPREELLDSARDYAKKIASYSRPILAAYKKALLESSGLAPDGMDKMNRIYLDDVAGEPDYVEGLQAFLDGRQPSWN